MSSRSYRLPLQLGNLLLSDLKHPNTRSIRNCGSGGESIKKKHTLDLGIIER